MEGMDGNAHDRFEKLEFNDANAGSPTTKDSSDDHQGGTKGGNAEGACPLCATSSKPESSVVRLAAIRASVVSERLS
jgi:hypothetical protein